VLSEQVYTLMHDGEERSTDEEDAARTDTDSVGYDSEGAGSSATQMRKRRQRQRRRRRWDSKKYSAAELARVRSIPGFATVLCRSECTLLCKSGNMSYGKASLPMKGRTQYTIRAAPVFQGSLWFDWLRYRGPDGALRVGQAALVVTSRARGWEQLIVRRAEKTKARPGCVLTQYGCECLQWDMDAEGDAVRLNVLTTADIVGWISVELGLEDLSERHGVTVMTNDVPNRVEERRASLVFVNALVVRESLGVYASNSEFDTE